MSTRQSMPTPGREPVAPSLKEAFSEWLDQRTESGIAAYGRPLETFNGRDPEQDSTEELLDFCQYRHQAYLELKAERQQWQQERQGLIEKNSQQVVAKLNLQLQQQLERLKMQWQQDRQRLEMHCHDLQLELDCRHELPEAVMIVERYKAEWQRERAELLYLIGDLAGSLRDFGADQIERRGSMQRRAAEALDKADAIRAKLDKEKP